MAPTEDREIVVRTSLRELVVYVVFLVVLSILAVSTTSSVMYYYTKAMSDLFLDAPFSDTDNNLRDSTHLMDFWRFVEGPLLDGLYWESWYDLAKTKVDSHDSNILYENRLLGVPRMRQLRVRDDSCRVADDMRVYIKACYAEYSWLTEVPIGATFGNGSGTAWRYSSAKDLGASSVWGLVGSYSGAGAYLDLSTDRAKTSKLLAELRKNLWIGRGTRAVFIDFTVYNANINLFCVIKLVFELPATGGMIPSFSFRTVKLLRYVTPYDYFIMACEWIFVVFILYYIVEEVLEVRRMKWSYFRSFWNVLDILVIVIAIVCVAFSVYCTTSVDHKIALLLKDDIRYTNFEHLGFYQTQFTTVFAILMFFAWVKLFKYISFNKTMNQLSNTLSRCSKDIMGFGIMFFIVFFAFAQLGYLLFGTQVRDFKSFGDATFTLLRTILGDFDFHEIEAANRILGPIFFLSYVFFVFFVLMNMFLAIINDTYSEVKNDVTAHKNEFEVVDYLRRGYNNVLGKLGKRDKMIDMENALKLAKANSDGTYPFEEIRETMKTCNFSDGEVDLFFEHYDLHKQDALDESTRRLRDEQGNQNPPLDIDRLHTIVFGDISREAAAAQLRDSAAPAEHHRGGEGDGDEEREEYSSESMDDEYYDDFDDYDDIERRASSRRSRPSNAYGGYGGVSPEQFGALTHRVDQMELTINSVSARVEAMMGRLEGEHGSQRATQAMAAGPAAPELAAYSPATEAAPKNLTSYRPAAGAKAPEPGALPHVPKASQQVSSAYGPAAGASAAEPRTFPPAAEITRQVPSVFGPATGVQPPPVSGADSVPRGGAGSNV